MTLAISEGGSVPKDETPFTPDDTPTVDSTEATGWFDPEYPHSTEEHPYGFFPDGKGGWDFNRPRKRRPHKRSTSSVGTVASSARADNTARTAAALLARVNSLVGLSLTSFGMPMSGEALNNANETFKELAYEALQTDPELARKILSAGASSGKAQLGMAYVMLAGSIAPVAFTEVKANREDKRHDG